MTPLEWFTGRMEKQIPLWGWRGHLIAWFLMKILEAYELMLKAIWDDEFDYDVAINQCTIMATHLLMLADTLKHRKGVKYANGTDSDHRVSDI